MNAIVYAGSDDLPATIMLDARSLVSVKQAIKKGDKTYLPAYKALLAVADKALKICPPSVVDKKHLPSSKNPHDYFTVASYAWPNPNTPDGLPWIQKDGYSNPVNNEFDRVKLKKMYQSVIPLAMAGWFSDEKKYMDRAAEMLRVFFLYKKTKMNPNLNYAQSIPGKCDGVRYGIIATSYLSSEYFLDAALLVAQSKSLSEEEYAGLQQWFRDFVLWLQKSKFGKEMRVQQHNNIRTSYELQLATMSMFTGDIEYTRKILENFKDECVARQIRKDGMQPEELWRTKSLGYSAKNLKFMLQMGLLGKKVGVDIFGFTSPKGVSIQKSVDAHIPYWIGKKEWQYKQIKPIRVSRPLYIMRWSAIGFEDSSYEELIPKIKGKPEIPWNENILQLLWPASSVRKIRNK